MRSGRTSSKPPELPPNATEDDVRKLAWDQMRTCYDPEIPINIVDLGLVYECDVQQNGDGTRSVDVKMTLTAPGCGMGEVLVEDVREKIERIPTVQQARVELDFRSAVEPEHDVRSRAPADRDVLSIMPAEWVDLGAAEEVTDAAFAQRRNRRRRAHRARAAAPNFTRSRTAVRTTGRASPVRKSRAAKSSVRATARASA